MYSFYYILFREFSNERTRVERRETFRKLRMRENFSRAFEGYFQWISKAGIWCIAVYSRVQTLPHLVYTRAQTLPPLSVWQLYSYIEEIFNFLCLCPKLFLPLSDLHIVYITYTLYLEFMQQSFTSKFGKMVAFRGD